MFIDLAFSKLVVGNAIDIAVAASRCDETTSR